MKHLPRLWAHFNSRRRRQLGLLCLLMLFSSVAELVSLGAIIPFLAAMTAPAKVYAHPAVAPFVDFMKIASPNQLLLPLAVVFSLAALVAAGLRMLLLWAGTRLAFSIGADISIGIYQRTLHQPYAVHVARNSSEVISGITTKSHAVIYGGLMPALQLASAVFTLVAIIAGLLTVDPQVALATLFGFGAVYGLLIGAARKRLAENGKRIAQESTRVLKCLQEGLGGIRDVLLDGSQPTYCKSYCEADLPLRRAQGNNQFISTSPRYAMEAIGLSMIAALAYYLVRQPEGIERALPVLGVLALGAQRLLPTLQQAYAAWAGIKGNQASVQDALALLEQPMPDSTTEGTGALTFDKTIRMQAITFAYQPTHPAVLKNLELTIRKGERVGIIGATGSGKSTLMDLLMGLLEPSGGRLEVDGQTIDSTTRRAWQSRIAHVPQAIYLADSSVEENIAFGVPRKEIDHARVVEAAQQAQIAELIESMPDGYRSQVGERGVRLSGGQRQRIGIARALYKQADVIVFDEATSALDNETERTVMESIDTLKANLTVVIIAHRLSTLQKCDRIVELGEGGVKRIGSYEQIVDGNR
jgi:ABC-type multidrug transport system fused ATPase/permease subunit